MSTNEAERTELRCLSCGRAAPVGDDWERIEATGIGTLTRCPGCGSTNVQHAR